MPVVRYNRGYSLAVVERTPEDGGFVEGHAVSRGHIFRKFDFRLKQLNRRAVAFFAFGGASDDGLVGFALGVHGVAFS